jgi:hypothetical protein
MVLAGCAVMLCTAGWHAAAVPVCRFVVCRTRGPCVLTVVYHRTDGAQAYQTAGALCWAAGSVLVCAFGGGCAATACDCVTYNCVAGVVGSCSLHASGSDHSSMLQTIAGR